MKKQLLCAAIAVATTASMGWAKDKAKDPGGVVPGERPIASPAQGDNSKGEMERAVQRQFPGAKVAIEGEKDINGVKVYDVRITRKTGEPIMATVTDRGDFVATGTETNNAGNLPAPVRELTQGIWRTPPANVHEVMGTFYIVMITPASNKAGYGLRFDAMGRLLEMQAQAQLHHEDWKSLPDAPADVKGRLTQVAEQRIPHAHIEAVKQDPSAEFYQVRYTVNNSPGWIIADSRGDIASQADTIDKSHLPRAIQDAINSTFNGDRVVWVARNDQRFYEIRENVGNESVTMRVQPNGDVLSVHASRERESAVTASHRAK